MKKNLYTTIVLTISLFASTFIFGQETDSLSMGPGYSNDIFYSFENGSVSEVPRATWDIAFYTARFSAGILINEGSGAELYTYPHGDTAAWDNVDTANMETWTPMYNSAEVWEDGAFNSNATGHPDYGWGIYNMVDHSVYGDSIYVVKLVDGSYKKLFVKLKLSVYNTIYFKVANIDGSDLQDIEVDVVPYEDKRFLYYSIVNSEVVDREPVAESWDVLFTKYIDMVPDMDENLSPYLVTGVTSNVDIGANNFHPVASDFNDWSSKPFDSLKNTVGYDWKSFDMATFSWQLTDSNYYFVQTFKGDVYKLKFVDWSGSMTGNFVLEKSIASTSSIFESPVNNIGVEVYPNPATSDFTIKIQEDISGNAVVSIFDQTGRSVYNAEKSANDLNNGLRLNNLNLPNGLYIISVTSDNYIGNTKLMVR